MKTHPNLQFKEMLKNGTARIIDYKYIPYGSLPVHKIRIMTEDAEYNTADFIDDLTNKAVKIVSNVPLKTEAEQVIIEKMTPELVPNAAAVEVKPPEPVPSAAAVEVKLPEPAPIAAAVEVKPPEPAPSAAAVEVKPPEPMLRDIDIQLPELVPSADDVEIKPPEVEMSAITAEEKPTVESDCLVMELQLDVDPNGMILGIQSLPVKHNGVIASTEPDSHELGQDACSVLGASSVPLFINFVTFNRLGLTVKNLTRLLESDEDFELNIIDCNSKDNSWDYILSLTDPRIKSKIRFDRNCGPIFAVNYALARRKPNQYFMTLDSDTYIRTDHWITKFMEVFDAFPELGVLGLMRDNPYPRFLPPIIPRVKGDISYLELKNADTETQMDFIPGHFQCLSPALINEIGYWSEENGFGDAELSPRVVHYTNFKVGFLTTVEIDMTQRITCNNCTGKEFCTLSRSVSDCFSLSKKYNKNESFVAKNTWKFKKTFQELAEGQRTAYCASIHDPESLRTHKYNSDWANDNFSYYIINGN